MKMKNKRVGVGPREFGMELCFSPHHPTHHPLRHRPFQRVTYSLGVQIESCELRTTLSYIASIPSIPNAEGNKIYINHTSTNKICISHASTTKFA